MNTEPYRIFWDDELWLAGGCGKRRQTRPAKTDGKRHPEKKTAASRG